LYEKELAKRTIFSFLEIDHTWAKIDDAKIGIVYVNQNNLE
jgi:hypothetical protein